MSAHRLEIDVRRLRFERCPNCGGYHLHPEIDAALKAIHGPEATPADVEYARLKMDEIYGEVRRAARTERKRGGDYVAGQLLVYSRRADAAARALLGDIRDERMLDVQLADSLDAAHERHGLERREGIDFDLHVVTVPEGAEGEMRAEIENTYAERAGIPRDLLDNRTGPPRFAVVRNPVIRASAAAAPAATCRAADFFFYGVHEINKTIIGADGERVPHAGVCVAILDSGVADDVLRVEERATARGYLIPGVAPDDRGHGTVIALMIQDLLPDATIKAYKVMDADGNVSTIDAIAVLSGETGAHVVNMSFELQEDDNPAAPPPERATLLMVFDSIIQACLRGPEAPILAASAGNRGRRSLAFPARFPYVLAVGAVNTAGRLTRYSSVGGLDWRNRRHEHFYVMPGGNPDEEEIGGFRPPMGWEVCGTSFATAYASAAVAHHWARMGMGRASRGEVLAALPGHALSLPDYGYATHGHGLLRF